MTTTEDIPFDSTWVAWYHYDTANWTPASFRRLATISTVGELWATVEGFMTIENVMLEHIYVMREGVMPVWEDTRNRSGGCWSIKVDMKQSFTIFIRLLTLVMGENSMYSEDGENLSKHVMGISFCVKNVYSVICQCWLNDRTLNKINLLHTDITKDFISEMIFRSHEPEY